MCSRVSDHRSRAREDSIMIWYKSGYECNDLTKDQKYAVTNYDGTTLSAPAFEIRWRSADLAHGVRTTEMFPPGIPTPFPTLTTSDVSTSKLITTTTNTLVPAPTSTLSISSAIVQFTPTNGSSSPTPKPNAALGPGIIAGITVGSCLGLLVVASAIMFLLVHRRRKYQGPSRIMDDTWCQQDVQKEPTELSATQRPAELGDKPMELRELPVEPQPCAEAEQPTHISRAHHIVTVNTIPVEVAADSSQQTTQVKEREN
ncbi:hypothetical protein V8C35DRAFT_286100 [Trichoderma chlorosporum]